MRRLALLAAASLLACGGNADTGTLRLSCMPSNCSRTCAYQVDGVAAGSGTVELQVVPGDHQVDATASVTCIGSQFTTSTTETVAVGSGEIVSRSY